jgi:hypothetical protein
MSSIIFSTKYPLVEMNEPFITASGFVLSVLNWNAVYPEFLHAILLYRRIVTNCLQ